MYDVLFKLLFFMVLPFWAAMILAPGWRHTALLVSTPLIAVTPALVYAVLALSGFGTVITAVLPNEARTVGEFLATPARATIAWAHFLAGDLFLGRWIYRDMRERGRSALICSPVLLLTFLLAPLGLLAHVALRSLPGRVRPAPAIRP